MKKVWGATWKKNADKRSRKRRRKAKGRAKRQQDETGRRGDGVDQAD